MTYAEQIAAFEARRKTLVDANDEIMAAAGAEGATLDAEQKTKFDENEADLAEVDEHLKRLRAQEARSKAAAVPAAGGNEAEAGASRSGSRIELVREEKLAPGIGFARMARCYALAEGDKAEAIEVAKALYGENAGVVGALTAARKNMGLKGVGFDSQQKSAVVAGSTTSGNWAESLTGTDTSIYADFADYLRPMTILGKFGQGGVPSLRSIPFRTALITQTGAGAGYWVGEGKPKPLTSFDFSRTTLSPLKVANIAVVTEETLRSSSPAADSILRDQLVAALQARLDTDFVDPSKSASAGVSPASITYGAQVIASQNWTDADDVRLDIRSVFQYFINANNPPSNGVWIMSTGNALALSLLMNGLGQPEFPGIGMNGGVLAGLPVITSEYVGSYVVLVNASDIYLGDEGGFRVDLSTEASLEMLDGSLQQNSLNGTGASLVSMFQTNCVAFRAEREINWATRRDTSVVYLSNVAWGGAVNSS